VSDEEWLAAFRRNLGDPEALRKMMENREFLDVLARRLRPDELQKIIDGIGNIEELERHREFIRNEVRKQQFWVELRRIWHKATGNMREFFGLVVIFGAAWVLLQGWIMSLINRLLGGAP